MEKLKLKIITPDKIVYESDAIDKVTVPTNTGEITILPLHVPMISILQAGEMIFTEGEKIHHFAVAGGFLEIKNNNRVMVLADNVEAADQIDVDRAQAAKEKALAQMKALKNTDDVDFVRMQALIERESNRIRLGSKWKKHTKDIEV